MKIQKIGIPVFHNRISPLFDVSGQFNVYLVEDRSINDEYYIKTNGFCDYEIIQRILKDNINIIICGAISCTLASYIHSQEIHLITNIIGDATEVMQAFLNDNLCDPSFLMPGGESE